MVHPAVYGLIGTGFTFFMTALGAALVFFMKRTLNRRIQNLLLGFASGVMIAASVWSLLIPALDSMKQRGAGRWIFVVAGFTAGAALMFLLNRIIMRYIIRNGQAGGGKISRRSMLMVSAVTIHNIPEGMAVGLAFAMAARATQGGAALLTQAAVLALCIGLQNFPEGAAVSIPLKSEGCPTAVAFVIGAMSGIVEPVFGVLTVLIADGIALMMPILLSFAAGAMIYVVVEELIPQSSGENQSQLGTTGFLIGFLVMMVLDVVLA